MVIEGAAKGPSYYLGTNSLWYRRDNMEIRSALDKGLSTQVRYILLTESVTDWDLTEQLWDHAFKTRLGIDPKAHPILMSEPSFNTK
jgi:actin-like protein 6A